MSKCASCGYERPSDAQRAARYAHDLSRSNPQQYPPEDAEKAGAEFVARGVENCGACGVPWVAAVEPVTA